MIFNTSKGAKYVIINLVGTKFVDLGLLGESVIFRASNMFRVHIYPGSRHPENHSS